MPFPPAGTSEFAAVPTVRPARAATAVSPCRARPAEPNRPVPTPCACARSTLRSPLGLSPRDLSALATLVRSRLARSPSAPLAVTGSTLASSALARSSSARSTLAMSVGFAARCRPASARLVSDRCRGGRGRSRRRLTPRRVRLALRSRRGSTRSTRPAYHRDRCSAIRRHPRSAYVCRAHGRRVHARRVLALRSGPSRARRRYPGRPLALLRAVARCHCQVRRRWTIRALPRSLGPPPDATMRAGRTSYLSTGLPRPYPAPAGVPRRYPAGRPDRTARNLDATALDATASRSNSTSPIGTCGGRHTVNNAWTSRPASRLRPFRNPSSSNTQRPATIPPACSTRPECRLRRAARGEHVVDHEHPVPGHEGVGVHLEGRLAVFQRVRRRDGGSGQLAGLAYGDHADPRRVRHGGRDHEAARLDAGDDVEGRAHRPGPDRSSQCRRSAHGTPDRRRTAGSGP